MPQHDVVASFTRVSKRYGTTEALRDVDLRIRAGEAVALLGPNGAGKTTAVNLLLGILTPSSGRVRVFGNDPSSRASRQRVGAMLQIAGVPQTLRVAGVPQTLRVREHVELFRSYYPDPLEHPTIIAIAGLMGVENRLYGKLSGGQKQRLHLALALGGNPELLFLDEPTAGLDVTSRRALWDELRKLVDAGRAVVLTTHYIEEAEALADQIVVLDQGRVIASATPAEIKRATSRSRIAAVTKLERAIIDAWPNVTHVRQSADRTEIFASQPEPVVRQLLALDPELHDLEVTRTTLEEAFLTLTQSDLRP